MHSINDLDSFYRKFPIYPNPYHNEAIVDKTDSFKNGTSHYYKFNDGQEILNQLTFSDFKVNLSIHDCLDNLTMDFESSK
jgi:hypothetical protein